MCPVATFTEYYTRIVDITCSVPHPKAKSVLYVPLIRNCKDLAQPVGKDTISRHARLLNDLLQLPKDMKAPRGHATGSSAAHQAGVPSSDITAYANWSSSVLFDKFYRLGSNTSTNFTTTVLRDD
ncbi:hypothetical protein BG000_006864 [Podila horticola]|nr:hypothetical protein BG000_006864 [Podila horticola]